MSETAETGSYRGLPGAFPYAFRRSRSRLFKLYAVVAAALSLLIGLLFVLALIYLIGWTLDSTATLSLSRSFLVVVGLFVVVPIVAPILFVARRHRRAIGDDARYDRRLAVSGFGFIVSLYVGLIISTPSDEQATVGGASGVVVDALYALPWAIGLLLPVVAALSIYWMHRLSR